MFTGDRADLQAAQSEIGSRAVGVLSRPPSGAARSDAEAPMNEPSRPVPLPLAATCDPHPELYDPYRVVSIVNLDGETEPINTAGAITLRYYEHRPEARLCELGLPVFWHPTKPDRRLHAVKLVWIGERFLVEALVKRPGESVSMGEIANLPVGLNASEAVALFEIDPSEAEPLIRAAWPGTSTEPGLPLELETNLQRAVAKNQGWISGTEAHKLAHGMGCGLSLPTLKRHGEAGEFPCRPGRSRVRWETRERPFRFWVFQQIAKQVKLS